MENASSSCSEDPFQSGCPSHQNKDFKLFYGVHILALILTSISATSCLIVIFSIIHKRCKLSRKDVADRFPLYIAINDFLFGIIHGTDHLVLLVTGVYPPKWVVYLFGTSSMFLLWYQQLMYALIAVYTYLDVACEKRVTTGKWDWRLHIVAASLAGITLGILVPLDSIGISRFWMGAHESDPTTVMYNIIASTTFTTIQAICTITAYSSIRRVVLSYKSRLQIGQISNSYHDTAAMCLLTFVKIGAILYLPTALVFWTVTLDFASGRHIEGNESLYAIGMFIIVVLCNCGGFINTMGYFTNKRIKREGKRGRKQSSVKTSTISLESSIHKI